MIHRSKFQRRAFAIISHVYIFLKPYFISPKELQGILEIR